jgi:hypothetical protein
MCHDGTVVASSGWCVSKKWVQKYQFKKGYMKQKQGYFLCKMDPFSSILGGFEKPPGTILRSNCCEEV